MIPKHIAETQATAAPPAADPHAECRAVGEVLGLIGDKWTVMVVGTLSGGPKRFNELRRGIGGVSQRMLTIVLRRLEEEALVTRTVFPTVPPRVDYELTPRGHTLIEPLRALAEWAIAHRTARQAEREAQSELPKAELTATPAVPARRSMVTPL